MPRRVPIRLARLLAIACALLVPAAAAHAAAPTNDTQSAAQQVTGMGWTSLTVSQDIVVQSSDWADATTGPEDADPLPSCTGSVGFKSQWYSVSVPEAAVLRVIVVSTDLARYQPVVTVLDPSNDEVACGLAAIGKAGATANATAYVTPKLDGTPAIYLVRVAQVTLQSPNFGLPMLTVRFSGRDVTPPHIKVAIPSGRVQPKTPTVYNAGDTTDNGSQIDPQSAHWEFDETINHHTVTRTRTGLRVTYTWRSSGPHSVVFKVSDFAGNESMYRFTTFVQDTIRPTVKFRLLPPEPGARRLNVTVTASESIRLHLLITQVGKARPLLRRTVTFWGSSKHARSIALGGIVGDGLLVVSGIARDLAGNGTDIGHCAVDPVSGGGSCASP